MNWNRLVVFDKSADQGEGGSAADDDTEGSGSGDAVVDSALQGLLSRHGDASKVALHLLQENYRLRSKNRNLTERSLKDGQVAMSTEDQQLLATYRALGEPAALQQSLQELQTTRRADHIRTVAEAAGFKPSVLGTLLGDLKVEVKKETIEGKEVSYAVVLREGQEAVRLRDYAENNWPDFMPALLSAQSGSQTTSTMPQGGQPTYPRQTRGDKVTKDDPVAARIAASAERAKGKNPLVRGE